MVRSSQRSVYLPRNSYIYRLLKKQLSWDNQPGSLEFSVSRPTYVLHTLCMGKAYPKEVAVDLELYLDEEDVVREVNVAPGLDFLQAHGEAVAR